MHLFARREPHTHGTPVADEDLVDSRLETNLAAVTAETANERLGDLLRSTDGVVNATVVSVPEHDRGVDERNLRGAGERPGEALDLEKRAHVGIPQIPSRNARDVDERVVHQLGGADRESRRDPDEVADVLDRLERHPVQAAKERVDAVVEAAYSVTLVREECDELVQKTTSVLVRPDFAPAGKVVVDLNGIVNDLERLAELVEHLAHEASRSTLNEAVEKRRADVEAIPLSFEARGAAARRGVLLVDDDVEASLREQRGRDEPADACTDHYDVVKCARHADSSCRVTQDGDHTIRKSAGATSTGAKATESALRSL